MATSEISQPTMRVLEELARTDGSVAWTVMIGATAPVMLGMLPTHTFEGTIYAAGPDLVVGGTFNPTGSTIPTDGGYMVNGRWTFASGCQHSDWFLAHCIVDDGRMPPMRMMVVPAADVDVIDTWRVAGLRRHRKPRLHDRRPVRAGRAHVQDR